METIPPTRLNARSLTFATALAHRLPPASIDSHRQVRAPGFRATPVEHHQRIWNCSTECAAQQEECVGNAAIGDARREEPDGLIAGRMAGGPRWKDARSARRPEATLRDLCIEEGNAAIECDNRGRDRKHWRRAVDLAGNRDDGQSHPPAALRVLVAQPNLGGRRATRRADEQEDDARGDRTPRPILGHRRTESNDPAGMRASAAGETYASQQDRAAARPTECGCARFKTRSGAGLTNCR